eukprot:8948632-Pyramimonas_sp.AAC.1
MAKCLFPFPSLCFPCKGGSAPGFSRAGWAVVQIDPAGNLIGAMFGAAPLHAAPGQAAQDGEDW